MAIVKYEACNWTDPEPIQGRILPPNCDERATETSLELACVLQSLGPGKALVQWLKNGEAEEEAVEVKLAGKGDKNKGYIGLVRREISKRSWDQGDQHSCKVTPMQGSKNVTIHTTSKCKACYGLRQPPTVSITKPSYRDLLEKTGKVTCTAIGFDLSNTKITWQVDGKPSSEVQDDMAKANASGYPKVASSHPVTLEQWRKGTTFTCKVAGGCYEDIIQVEKIKKETDAVKPSITLARASFDVSLENRTALILICNVAGFYPREISISWRKDDVPLDVNLYKNGIVTTAAGNVYKTYSILKIGIEGAGEKGGRYTCVVYHSSSESEIIANENVSVDFLKPAPPEVMAFYTSENQEHHTLVCFATNFYPKEIDIQWNIKGHDLSCLSASSTVVSLVNGRFQKNCSVVLRREEWSQLEMYTCTVNHSSTNAFIEKHLYSSEKPYCAGTVPTPNNATVIKMQLPSFEELFVNKSATLTCMVPFMNITPSSTFSWTMDGQPADGNAVTTGLLNETNGLAWISSQLRMNLTQWKTTMEFNCSIPSISGETKQRVYRRNGAMKPPKVSLQHYSSNEDLNVTLLCMAQDFYPGEIFLKWEKEDQELSLKAYDVKDMKCDHEQQSCSLMSILEVPTTQWTMGISYTCLVAHIASENITTRRINSLSGSCDCTLMGVALGDLHNENQVEGTEMEETNNVWNKVSTFIILFVAALLYAGLVTFIKVK